MTTHERPLSAAGDAYLAAAGAALTGVPDSDRQELLDDLAEHLAELGHESDSGLVDRLGPPEQYATDLLSSAGIERAPVAGWHPSRLVEHVVAVTARFDSPSVHKLQKFALELRPGWWVARGWLAVAALAARNGLQEALWFPNVTRNNHLANFVLLVAAIALSVWAGRGPKWAAWIATALGIVALISVVTANRAYFYQVNDQSYYPSPRMLTDPNGRTITNIFAYNAAAKPIPGVFLTDQSGAPIDVGDGLALQENGVPYISGWFPQPTLIANSVGILRGVQPKPPPFAAPRLPQPAKATATTKPKVSTTTNPPTGASGATG